MKHRTQLRSASETFSPPLVVAHPLAGYWLRQATTRLRREICWMRRQRELAPGTLMQPVSADCAADSLAQKREWEEKQCFFKTDPTSRYLSDQLSASPPEANNNARGSFDWVDTQLDLNGSDAFALGLGLLSAFDSAAGSVIAVCQYDSGKTLPTLGLAQRLWDEPEQMTALADPAHVLFRFGLVGSSGTNCGTQLVVDWEIHLSVPALVAPTLLDPETPLPSSLLPLAPIAVAPSLRGGWKYLVNAPQEAGLRVVPLLGRPGTAFHDALAEFGHISGKPILECRYLPGYPEDGSYLKSIATLAWLRNFDLYFDAGVLVPPGSDPQPHASIWLALQDLPVRFYIGVTDKRQTSGIPGRLLEPAIPIMPLSYHERKTLWHSELGSRAAALEKDINDCSQRFRYEKETIRVIASKLCARPDADLKPSLPEACRLQVELDLGELAQKVTPRFEEDALVLPEKDKRHFDEVAKAMESLSTVHHTWGTARAWNEAGISVLFAGPPGTGKTMAAEILAHKLNLPLYRIDLSQVVNKYIGETEKNLKRLFDAADVTDIILFFDEADSLFGRRTEVKDAHDRYANLEISYLLERMERFKGLAILATNRKKDLDEAFLRRLRYIVDFPFPEAAERRRIWMQSIPAKVDHSALDVVLLARKFKLTGGHIASIVFNACLQSCDALPLPDKGYVGKLTMERVLAAVQREYDKMDRSFNPELPGPYADAFKGLDNQE